MILDKIKNNLTSNGIAIGFGLIIVLMLGQTVLALLRFNEVKVEFVKVVDVYNVRMQLVQKMRVISRERAPILFSMVTSDDPFEIDDLKTEFFSLGSRFIDYRKKLVDTKLSDREQKMLANHAEFAKSIVPGQRKVIELIEDEDYQAAQDLLVKEVSPLQVEALTKLDEIIIFESVSSKIAMNKARKLFDITQRDLILTTIFGTVFSLIIGLFVSIRFAHFVKALKLSRDDLEVKVAERTISLMEMNEKLQHMANYDALTELPNRSLFLEHLSQNMKQMKRNKKSLALLFIDLDGFKSINDDYGHDYGDEILRQVAKRVSETLRDEDVFARLGGDEFTLIASNITEEGLVDNCAIKIVAQKVIKVLSEPFDVIDATCHIGSSIGISLYPSQTTDLDELISHADTAMYAVKNSGKNNFKIYDSSMEK